MKRLIALSLTALSLVLSGCGGGGGGSSATPPPPQAVQMSFSPASINVSATSGTSSPIVVTATVNRVIAETVNVVIADSVGVLEPSVTITSLTTTSYQVTLTSKAALAAGTYKGNFEIRLCLDTGVACAQPYPGSPWQLPYTITVAAKPSAAIPPSSQSAQQCAPDNPYTADATSATKAGSLALEKQWMRSYVDENYLWYDSVPVVDPAASAYSGSMTALDGAKVPLPLSNYFSALKTPLHTPSGALTDKFSFAYPTKAWNDLSQSGVVGGYGIEWVYYNSTAPNRLWRVAFVQPNTPASAAGIVRGDTLKTIDGVDFANGADTTTLNNGIQPSVGSTHKFVLSRVGSVDITANLQGTAITIDPVPVTAVVNDPNGRKVGYLHFTDHVATSEAKLISAINTLQASNVTDLVLDMRYNGGGYLYIASELAYMIAGPTRVSGKYFEKLQYNAKRVTDNAQAATPFFNTSCILDSSFNCTQSQALPTLNLPRVFIIATADTCSASEAVINGLRGVDVDVQLIGGTTCGKPYGFSAKDNCGTSYFPIEFRGINFKGFGDYADGFTPTTGTPGNTSLAGCAATDDLDHPLGNTSEKMLAAALQRAANGSCPAPSAGFAVRQQSGAELLGRMVRDPARSMRVTVPADRSR